MDMDSLMDDYIRKKSLLEEDMEYLLKLCTKMSELLAKQEADLQKVKDTMAKYPTVDDEIIRFNVGGTVFATSKSNITKKILMDVSSSSSETSTASSSSSKASNSSEKADKVDNAAKYYEPNMLEGLVSGIVQVKLDSTGAIFIDRDSKYFDVILDYLRAANTETPFEIDSAFTSQAELIKVAKFYNVLGLVELLESTKKIDSIILETSNQTTNLLDLIDTEMKKQKAKRFTLLYRATRDGFTASTFHQRCDNKGPTLTIIKVRPNYIFGGYTSMSWDSSGTHKSDPNAFIFSLLNKQNTPLIFKCSDPSKAIYCDPSYAQVFGAGNDLLINSQSDIHTCSSRLGVTYTNPSTASSLLAGSTYFVVAEIEVFKVT